MSKKDQELAEKCRQEIVNIFHPKLLEALEKIQHGEKSTVMLPLEPIKKLIRTIRKEYD